jgi:hypothetical protein
MLGAIIQRDDVIWAGVVLGLRYYGAKLIISGKNFLGLRVFIRFMFAGIGGQLGF